MVWGGVGVEVVFVLVRLLVFFLLFGLIRTGLMELMELMELDKNITRRFFP